MFTEAAPCMDICRFAKLDLLFAAIIKYNLRQRAHRWSCRTWWYLHWLKPTWRSFSIWLLAVYAQCFSISSSSVVTSCHFFTHILHHCFVILHLSCCCGNLVPGCSDDFWCQGGIQPSIPCSKNASFLAVATRIMHPFSIGVSLISWQ